MAAPVLPTAIFCMEDILAIQLMRCLQKNGIRVPEDVSVMGLDGLTIGEYTVPRLTTIAQDVEALAERSVRILLHNIENQGTAHYEIVPVSLVDRESAKKLN